MPRAVIITFGEEDDVKRCHRSLQWADDIVLVDAREDRAGVEAVFPSGTRVVRGKGNDRAAARRAGIEAARHPWVLLVGADEEISQALAGEIRRLDLENSPLAGYYVPRVAVYMSRMIRHCGWGLDPALRLFHRDRGATGDLDKAETGRPAPSPGMCRRRIQHHPYRDIRVHLSRINSSSDRLAAEMFGQGGTAGTPEIFFRTAVKFVSTYFFRSGFLDGYPGFVISILEGYRVFLSYSKLLERREQGRRDVHE